MLSRNSFCNARYSLSTHRRHMPIQWLSAPYFVERSTSPSFLHDLQVAIARLLPRLHNLLVCLIYLVLTLLTDAVVVVGFGHVSMEIRVAFLDITALASLGDGGLSGHRRGPLTLKKLRSSALRTQRELSPEVATLSIRSTRSSSARRARGRRTSRARSRGGSARRTVASSS